MNPQITLLSFPLLFPASLSLSEAGSLYLAQDRPDCSLLGLKVWATTPGGFICKLYTDLDVWVYVGISEFLSQPRTVYKSMFSSTLGRDVKVVTFSSRGSSLFANVFAQVTFPKFTSVTLSRK